MLVTNKLPLQLRACLEKAPLIIRIHLVYIADFRGDVYLPMLSHNKIYAQGCLAAVIFFFLSKQTNSSKHSYHLLNREIT